MNKYLIELISMLLTLILAIAGVSLVVIGTTDTTAGRFLIPPEILPGVGIIFFDAMLVGFFAVRSPHSTSVFRMLGEIVKEKVGEPESKKLRTMTLLLCFCILGFSMTHGATPMYGAIARSFALSLAVNIFISIVAAVGVFGWSAYFFMSKKQK